MNKTLVMCCYWKIINYGVVTVMSLHIGQPDVDYFTMTLLNFAFWYTRIILISLEVCCAWI